MTEIEVSGDRKLIYNSPAMQRVVEDVKLFAPSDMPVVITGSNGTGKENIARLVHSNSKRSDKAFMAINCAAISPNLIESELFGHEKGSFTGANTRHTGKFEKAADGTLFLDEIGEMPADMQTKLLRVLQDGEFSRVGSNEVIVAKPRIIAATNRDPEEAIKSGKLREDLYYRLRGVNIELPDLKSRTSDIPMLARYFIEKAVQKYELKTPAISDDALSVMMDYAWPGNVRELENRMGEATFRAQATQLITPEMLRLPSNKAKAKLSADSASVQETFGFKISTYREERGWTQIQLARQINLKTANLYQMSAAGGVETPFACTEKDVWDWESNKQVPTRDVINTLAYLLIVNSPLGEEEKNRRLVEFYEKAEHSLEATAKFEGIATENDFGALLRELREKSDLTQTVLAEQVSAISRDGHMSWQDIYLIENNHPTRRVTPKESLALVKALDSNEHPLSVHDKMELYDSAKRSFTRAVPEAASLSHADVEGMIQAQRSVLRDFFYDSENTEVSKGTISEKTKLRPQIVGTLVGYSKSFPADVPHALGDETCEKLAAYLKTLGKQDHVLDQFIKEFARMKQIANLTYSTGMPGAKSAALH